MHGKFFYPVHGVELMVSRGEMKVKNNNNITDLFPRTKKTENIK